MKIFRPKKKEMSAKFLFFIVQNCMVYMDHLVLVEY